MKFRYSIAAALLIALMSPGASFAAKGAKGAAGADDGEARLVQGIMALDPAITAVRPASVREPGRARFPIVWMPAVTLRNKTAVKEQLAVAQKVVDFVVRFQGGVPTADVLGGVIAFVEGEGWEPEIGQVFYRVDRPSAPVEVWVGTRIIGDEGNVSCCDDAGRIGTIAGNRFQSEPFEKILAAVRAVLNHR